MDHLEAFEELHFDCSAINKLAMIQLVIVGKMLTMQARKVLVDHQDKRKEIELILSELKKGSELVQLDKVYI